MYCGQCGAKTRFRGQLACAHCASPIPNAEPDNKFGNVVFKLAGLVILAFAAVSLISTIIFLRGALSADGLVTFDEFGNGTHISIGFTTRSGEARSFSQNGFIFGYGKGSRVRVLYHPDGEACLNSFGALWGVPSVLLVLGSAFVFAGRRGLERRWSREIWS